MKSTDKPKFSKKWWATNKPAEIKGTVLEKTLQTAEKALADAQRKTGDERTLATCRSAVEAVGAAASKTISKECDAKKHKDVIAVLKKFEALVKSEVDRLKQALEAAAAGAEGDDDEPDDTGLFEVAYLGKCVRLLRKRKLNFACGVHSDAEQCRIIFSKKRSPKYLFKQVKGNKSLGLAPNRLTFGVAYPDAKEKTTMVLELDDEASQPMGIIKKMKKLLKKQKEKYRPFRAVTLVVRGVPVQDIPDPEDPDTDEDAGGDVTQAEFQARLEAFRPKLQVAQQAQTPHTTELRRHIDAMQSAAKQQDFTAAMESLSQLETLVEQILNELAGSRDRDLAAEITALEQEVEQLIKEYQL